MLIELKGGNKMKKETKKTKKFNKRYLAFGILGLFALALVSAAVITYYALFSVTVNVNQPIEVTYDGSSVFGKEIPMSVDCNVENTCLGGMIKVNNIGNENKVVTITTVGTDDNVKVNYVGKLLLTKKNSSWSPIATPIELTYTVVGEEFEFSGVLPDYTLIYYKDRVVGLDNRTDNPQPAITVTSDIGSLPHNDDVNAELENYCQNPDNYAHCNGAKLWIVPDGDLDVGNLNWANMFDGYYYETDLIWYSDSANELTVPANSFIEFYPQFEVNKYAPEGQREITITIA